MVEDSLVRPGSAGVLLILGCSVRKRHDPIPLPALQRYDGVNYRVVARALRVRRGGCPPTSLGSYAPLDGLDILIISAKFGVITPETLIPDYDRRMTPARALDLQRAVSADLDARLAAVSYREVFVNLGKTYLAAIAGAKRLRVHPQVIYATGGIGQKMGQMKRWLDALEGAATGLSRANPPTTRER